MTSYEEIVRDLEAELETCRRVLERTVLLLVPITLAILGGIIGPGRDLWMVLLFGYLVFAGSIFVLLVMPYFHRYGSIKNFGRRARERRTSMKCPDGNIPDISDPERMAIYVGEGVFRATFAQIVYRAYRRSWWQTEFPRRVCERLAEYDRDLEKPRKVEPGEAFH